MKTQKGENRFSRSLRRRRVLPGHQTAICRSVRLSVVGALDVGSELSQRRFQQERHRFHQTRGLFLAAREAVTSWPFTIGSRYASMTSEKAARP